eukprot:scaffold957_cov402-Prasinococcus_capsulatus_cf.AAC.26
MPYSVSFLHDDNTRCCGLETLRMRPRGYYTYLRTTWNFCFTGLSCLVTISVLVAASLPASFPLFPPVPSSITVGPAEEAPSAAVGFVATKTLCPGWEHGAASATRTLAVHNPKARRGERRARHEGHFQGYRRRLRDAQVKRLG